MESVETERVRVGKQVGGQFLVVTLRMDTKYGSGIHCQRAVNVDGYRRQYTGIFHLIQHVNNLLGTTDTESRNDQFPFFIQTGVFDHIQESTLFIGGKIMQAVSVGGL